MISVGQKLRQGTVWSTLGPAATQEAGAELRRAGHLHVCFVDHVGWGYCLESPHVASLCLRLPHNSLPGSRATLPREEREKESTCEREREREKEKGHRNQGLYPFLYTHSGFNLVSSLVF